MPGWQRCAEAEQVFEAELGVGLRELAVDRVRGELVEEREDLVEDAALVALDVNLPLLMAKSGHDNLRSLQKYACPSAEAVAAMTAAHDPARQRR